jgi:hypothetical protein
LDDETLSYFYSKNRASSYISGGWGEEKKKMDIINNDESRISEKTNSQNVYPLSYQYVKVIAQNFLFL